MPLDLAAAGGHDLRNLACLVLQPCVNCDEYLLLLFIELLIKRFRPTKQLKCNWPWLGSSCGAIGMSSSSPGNRPRPLSNVSEDWRQDVASLLPFTGLKLMKESFSFTQALLLATAAAPVAACPASRMQKKTTPSRKSFHMV